MHHFVGIADFDQDGRADIVSAMMHQGKAPTEVKIYVNQDSGRSWSKQVLSIRGSHNMRIVDIDGDGDPDLFGANWEGENQEIRAVDQLDMLAGRPDVRAGDGMKLISRGPERQFSSRLRTWTETAVWKLPRRDCGIAILAGPLADGNEARSVILLRR